jgi:hypothetical protein
VHVPAGIATDHPVPFVHHVEEFVLAGECVHLCFVMMMVVMVGGRGALLYDHTITQL